MMVVAASLDVELFWLGPPVQANVQVLSHLEEEGKVDSGSSSYIF
jgi:hypothetical protein